MTTPGATTEDSEFRLRSGTRIRAGWLRDDLFFMTRSLRYLLRGESQALRLGSGLEVGDIGVLCVVALNPGISQNDLAASLVLKKSAVTRVVQRLEERGLLRRERSTTDRRANCLSLTEAGATLAAQVREATQARQQGWFEAVSPADRAVFFDVLFRLVAQMASADAPGSPGDDDD